MSFIVAALFSLAGLAMFWLYFHILLDESAVRGNSDKDDLIIIDEAFESLRWPGQSQHQNYPRTRAELLTRWDIGRKPHHPAASCPIH